MKKTFVLCAAMLSIGFRAEGKKPVYLFFRTYMAAIKNSIGTKIFRNIYYIESDGKTVDVLQNGNLSCAYYVSSMLLHFGLIGEARIGVSETVEAMKRAGWKKIEKPVLGSVIVWEEIYFKSSDSRHMHIGFYIGGGRAVSNSSARKCPAVHGLRRSADWRGRRRIIGVFWHDKLDIPK